MAIAVSFENKAELVDHLIVRAAEIGLGSVEPSDIKIEPYGGIDTRNGWDTHLVTIRGRAHGFTDSLANE